MFNLPTAWLLLELSALLSPETLATPRADRPPPILLELFTSQGCSSCPPADRLLTELAQEPGVLVLSFHVDYWNRLGWQDPFSSADWSARQALYAEYFGLDGVYTPQLVVNGHRQMVGSDEKAIRRTLAELRRQSPPSPLSLHVEAIRRNRRIEVVLALDGGENVGDLQRRRLWLAIAEHGLVTEVARGENAHKTLRHDGVVRHLGSLGVERGRQRYSVEVEPSWNQNQLTVVVFLQDIEDGRVLMAEAVEPLVRTQ